MTAPTRTAMPCDDPFCSSPGPGCGWSAAEHLRRPQPHQVGGLAYAPAAVAGLSMRDQPASPAPAAASVPPSTVELMRDVLTALDASRPRSLQVALGPSELGHTCDRQIAMKLAGVPRQPPANLPPWAPMQGTAVHGVMEEALHLHNRQLGRERWVIEEQLTIAQDWHGDPDAVPDEVIGHGDAYDTDYDMVVDWKHVGSTTLKKVKRKTIPVADLVAPQYRTQGHLYGWGHARAGRTPKWVRLVFLARSHDYNESTEWTEPYNEEIAAEAITRYWDLLALVRKLDLANTPALWPIVSAKPSDDNCSWCPFRRAGGPADGTGCPGNTESKIAKQLSGILA